MTAVRAGKGLYVLGYGSALGSESAPGPGAGALGVVSLAAAVVCGAGAGAGADAARDCVHATSASDSGSEVHEAPRGLMSDLLGEGGLEATEARPPPGW
jgi:hypothetical protein